MNDPSSHGSLLRTIAADSTSKVLSFDAILGGSKLLFGREILSRNQFTMVPGERFGDLYLGTSRQDVIGVFGDPDEIQHFEADDYEETVALYKYLNSQTGANLNVEDNPPQPELFFLDYKQLGLSVKLIEEKTDAIIVYTGTTLKTKKRDLKSSIPETGIPFGATHLERLKDVERFFGPPDTRHATEVADVPQDSIGYRSGISFTCHGKTGRILDVVIGDRD